MMLVSSPPRVRGKSWNHCLDRIFDLGWMVRKDLMGLGFWTMGFGIGWWNLPRSIAVGFVVGVVEGIVWYRLTTGWFVIGVVGGGHGLGRS